MRIVVCYPMRSLVASFVPEGFETLVAENEEECARQLSIHRPDAAILFSETFSRPIWEWVPAIRSVMQAEIPMIIVPLHRDEALIKRIVEELSLQRIYILAGALTYKEISLQISQILQISKEREHGEILNPRGGMVYTLLSYGGAGITTFCINYPVLLAKRHPDKRIAVIDMNQEKPDLSRFFGLREYQLSLYRPDLLSFELADKRNWLQAFKKSESQKNLFYSSATSNWRNYEISTLLAILKKNFDFIYLDYGYCFPENDAMERLLLESDRNIFFIRADPFSIEGAKNWMKRWEKKDVSVELMVSHFDRSQISTRRIREGVPLYGIVPRISDDRVIQSHESRSVLVEEIFPPKSYISCLNALAEAEQSREGAAI
ncbi:hypothetical protein [Brevibacillus migulae]|uniref:hypothetical protein n=1 Tax=Brevibacillus migulae TaxID=1644114 RepID=UPI00106E5EBA|nr:hypothetical protein [Brevibacillus migulae]